MDPDPAEGPLEQEIAAMYQAHSGGLYQYAFSLLREPEDSRDALQEVFLRYFTERRCGGEILNPRAWLYRVLRNLLLDWVDRAARKHEVSGANTDDFPGLAVDSESLI